MEQVMWISPGPSVGRGRPGGFVPRCQWRDSNGSSIYLIEGLTQCYNLNDLIPFDSSLIRHYPSSRAKPNNSNCFLFVIGFCSWEEVNGAWKKSIIGPPHQAEQWDFRWCHEFWQHLAELLKSYEFGNSRVVNHFSRQKVWFYLLWLVVQIIAFSFWPEMSKSLAMPLGIRLDFGEWNSLMPTHLLIDICLLWFAGVKQSSKGAVWVIDHFTK